MNRLILGDNQSIFRAGVARVLVREDDMRIVAQCEDESRLLDAIRAFRSSIIVVGRSMCNDLPAVLSAANESGSRVILVLENGKQAEPEVASLIFGACNRNVAGQALIDCVRRVARGQRCVQAVAGTQPQIVESVGSRVRQRLTPREMQIVSLIVQGCKNKDIASQLGTKEQVVKNYLRSVYDKVGVSDRLELALFAIHHRVVPQEPGSSGTRPAVSIATAS